jgi:hypothetical protein
MAMTFRLVLALCAVALLVLNWTMRRDGAPTVAPREPVAALTDASDQDGELRLVNQGWHITDMATAHGAFVIEVEAEDPSRTAEIARALVEPIKDDYVEILVYVNRLGDDSDLPARRMQWTPSQGYIELTYDQP